MFRTLSAARHQNSGIEANYTSEQAEAFYDGCGEGASSDLSEGEESSSGSFEATPTTTEAFESTPTTTEALPDEPNAVYLPDAWGMGGISYSIRPKLISNTSSNWFDGLVWSGWGTAEAVGRGVEHTSDCNPSCANGNVATTGARIIVSNIGKCQGRRYYLEIEIEGSASPLRVLPEGTGCTAY